MSYSLKMKKLFTLCILIFGISIGLQAKQIGLEVSYGQFMDETGDNYIELYFALNGSTLEYQKTSDGNFSAGMEVTLIFKQGETIISGDKFRVLSPMVSDTVDLQRVFLHQQRLTLPFGEYEMSMSLFDIGDPERVYDVEQKIQLPEFGSEVTSSEIMVLESFRKADEKSSFSKSGYEIIPLVSSGSYYLPDHINAVAFYAEIYNTANALGEGTPFLLKYYIEDLNKGRALDGYSSFMKSKAVAVHPLIASFDISQLPSGNYSLVVEAIDKEGNPLFKKDSFFYRKNSAPPLNIDDITKIEFTGSFVDNINSYDSLYDYIHYLFPVSSEVERNFQKSILDSRDINRMKQYFFAFWSELNPLDPEEEWKSYHTEIKIVNQKYGTRLRKGYMTDRGRVHLVYGRPAFVEARVFEPNLPPYEMWQYNEITSPFALSQVNKFFVFAEFQPSTNDYELLHSTAIGELNNRRWKYQLANGTFGVGGDIDSDNYSSGFDSYGSRINNNMIFQSAAPSSGN